MNMNIGPTSLSEMTPRLSFKKGWLVFALTGLLVAIDIIAPPRYLIEYLYIIPVFLSFSVLNKNGMLIVLGTVIVATLSDFVMPASLAEWNVPFILLSRAIIILFLLLTAFFLFYRKRYKEQLEKQGKLLSEAYHLAELREGFIAALSHDLKTPLLGGQKILGFMSDGTFGALNEEQKSATDALLRGNQLQLELVETLLTIYRNDNLGVCIRLSQVDLGEMVQQAVSQLEYLGREQDITLSHNAVPGVFYASADKVQIQRVLLNLLHNALDYAPPGSEIQIHLSVTDNVLSLSVRDQGPGLSADDLKNIFLRFYQVEAGLRPLAHSGLGLYLARQIVEAHEGEIWADNVIPQGFQISFRIPCQSAGPLMSGLSEKPS